MAKTTLERRALELLDTIQQGQPGPFKSAFVTDWQVSAAIEELRNLIQMLPNDAKKITVES